MITLAGTANYNSEASMLTTRTRMKYLRFMALDLARFVSKFYTAQKKKTCTCNLISQVTDAMIERYYKYNSGGKKFTQVQLVVDTSDVYCVLIMFLSFRYTPNI